MKLASACLGLAFVTTAAGAHDMWLQPETFRPEAGASVATQLYVGHGADRTRWGVSNTHVIEFEARTASGSVDQTSTLSLGAGEADAAPVFGTAATHVLTMMSRNSMSTLPAQQFNDYVSDAGITPIADARRAAGTEATEGRESYSRRAKAILKVCAADKPDDPVAATPVGHKLEIVPMVDPAWLADGRALPVKVLYEGKPVDGATLKVTDLSRDRPLAEGVITTAEGTALLNLPSRGEWLITTIWSSALERDPAADFDTIFASLSFDSRPCD
ncbi:MAG: DUF4198 domain-containing protein [Pacificimonas sp.]